MTGYTDCQSFRSTHETFGIVHFLVGTVILTFPRHSLNRFRIQRRQDTNIPVFFVYWAVILIFVINLIFLSLIHI